MRRAQQGDSTEALLVKAADKLEALLWAYEEYLLGNEHVRRAKIVEDVLSKLDRIELPSVQMIVAETRKKMRN
jgi:5'-deoxynucleotidase YfbR-like HD superfamily hydrolase